MGVIGCHVELLWNTPAAAQGAFVSFATFLPSLEKLSSLVHLHPTGLSPLFVNI